MAKMTRLARGVRRTSARYRPWVTSALLLALVLTVSACSQRPLETVATAPAVSSRSGSPSPELWVALPVAASQLESASSFGDWVRDFVTPGEVSYRRGDGARLVVAPGRVLLADLWYLVLDREVYCPDQSTPVQPPTGGATTPAPLTVSCFALSDRTADNDGKVSAMRITMVAVASGAEPQVNDAANAWVSATVSQYQPPCPTCHR